MCITACKNKTKSGIIVDNIIKSSKTVLENEGLIKFRVGNIITMSKCSSKTFYSIYEDKCDLLLCLWIRSSTSDYLVNFDNKKHQLNNLELMLLPFLITLSIRERSPSSNKAVSSCVNSSIWSGSSPQKECKVRLRVNFFWDWVRKHGEKLLSDNILQGSRRDIDLLCKKLSFLLRGFIWVHDSELVNNNLSHHDCSFQQLLSNELLPFGVEQAELNYCIEHCNAVIIQLLSNRKEQNNCQSCCILDQKIIDYQFDGSA